VAFETDWQASQPAARFQKNASELQESGNRANTPNTEAPKSLCFSRQAADNCHVRATFSCDLQLSADRSKLLYAGVEDRAKQSSPR
jgi:hypothetical protein